MARWPYGQRRDVVDGSRGRILSHRSWCLRRLACFQRRAGERRRSRRLNRVRETLSWCSTAREDKQVVREDRLTDGRDEVFPTFIETPSQAQHSFEKGDRSFDPGTETLSKTK